MKVIDREAFLEELGYMPWSNLKEQFQKDMNIAYDMVMEMAEEFPYYEVDENDLRR